MGDPHQKKFIESEMDRFEKEISSLAPAPSTSFIPAQLRRPPPAPPGASSLAASGTISGPPVVKATPVIISGAPQVYNASGKITKPSNSGDTSGTITKSAQSIDKNESTTGIGLMASVASRSFQPPTSTPSEGSTLGSTPQTSNAPMLGEPAPKPSTSSNAECPDKKKKKKKKKKDDKEKKPRKALRSAGGQIWEDHTLQDWDPSDFRLFCGDLGNDVTDEVLTRVFGRYPSFQKAKVVRDKRSNKTKGFGFVSFKDPNDFVRAIKELDGRYVGSRPIKLRKSNWRNRNLDQARKKDKERTQLLALIKK